MTTTSGWQSLGMVTLVAMSMVVSPVIATAGEDRER